ncbi:MAG: hypothetical protein EOP49_06790 [Sphingobacteriales bacterium]|nr:MAG: hypothetical protein EOP49_06790 [Sphingobacteriales bacterium]
MRKIQNAETEAEQNQVVTEEPEGFDGVWIVAKDDDETDEEDAGSFADLFSEFNDYEYIQDANE